MIEWMNERIAKYGTSAAAKKAALNEIYRALAQEGKAVALLNDKYLQVGDICYRLAASQGRLCVKTW